MAILGTVWRIATILEMVTILEIVAVLGIFNKQQLVLELLNVVKVKVKVKVKVTMKKFRNRFLLPESLDDL